MNLRVTLLLGPSTSEVEFKEEDDDVDSSGDSESTSSYLKENGEEFLSLEYLIIEVSRGKVLLTIIAACSLHNKALTRFGNVNA
ncbi:hypothetical protein SADUNF_Sadunf16G0133000 [Salix dunnii]|uniref:Uncharacterized protein n=1 Tax=Salix dunnii TaxID=1413687 RepID=A0A835J8H3_9ROSI|nr:hypothetical protein SADUNF_Sadunf16G0133000 [Salix dunnii]